MEPCRSYSDDVLQFRLINILKCAIKADLYLVAHGAGDADPARFGQRFEAGIPTSFRVKFHGAEEDAA
jgi:hypothetical protein